MTNEDIQVKAAQEWTDEMTRWDKADDRLRVMQPNTGMKVLKKGAAEGTLLGGNGGTFLLLSGTLFMPNLGGAILCVEEDELESPPTIDRVFHQLRQIGAYEKIKGMLIGRFNSKTQFTEVDSLEEIIDISTKGYSFSVIAGVDFGHTDPMITIPIGGKCHMDTSTQEIVFSQTHE